MSRPASMAACASTHTTMLVGVVTVTSDVFL